MTAIFAFAERDVTFVASDTKRGLSVGGSFTARKTQVWDERTLIAQTGFGEGLQRLVGEMLARQHVHPSFVQPGGAAASFEIVRAFRLEYERHHAKTASAVGGTLVVVEGGYLTTPASITTLDWTTGNPVVISGPVHGNGSNPNAFQRIAVDQYNSFRPGGSGPIDLGAWAMACIADAKQVQNGGTAVDWPIDLTIIRRDQGALITLSQRVAFGGTPHSLMAIP